MHKNIGVLFVCLGNICRSPTAHGVFEAKVAAHGLADSIEVDSAGTAAYHVGSAPDARASEEAALRGYALDGLRARQVEAQDFMRFDYILAMDQQNLADLRTVKPPGYSGHLGLFLDFAPEREPVEVPDPYYNGQEGFVEVLDLVEAASDGLLERLCRDHNLHYERTV